MFGLGVPEILIIAVIILLIFGAKRLPSIGTGLGQTVKEIKNIKNEMKDDNESVKKKQIEGSEDSASEGKSLEGKIVDSLQKKVTDKVIGHVPGIRQARQLKDKADKIKKLVS